MTHSKVLSSIRDLLILDKGKAFSGIINSSSWISSLGSCSSTLKSSSLSLVSSTGLHSELPSVSFMSEMLVPPKTFIVIKGRREGGSRCKLGNNCYCYRWSSGARRYVDGIFQNERKRHQHWQQRSLDAPFNCDRWFVQSLKKKGNTFVQSPDLKSGENIFFPHKALPPLALTVKYLHFNFAFFFFMPCNYILCRNYCHSLGYTSNSRHCVFLSHLQH